MRLYFTRHGESEANILNEISNRGCKHGLTEKGHQQAHTLASQLGEAGITRIYTSPLLRAVQTAEILAQSLQVEYEPVDGLREFDCGIAEGRSDTQAWDLWRWVMGTWLERGLWEERIEHGESFLDMKNRFLPFLDRLLEKERNGRRNFVLIGHGGLYVCMLPLVLRNYDRKTLGDHPFPNTGYVLAEAWGKGLDCLEWCGIKLKSS